MSHIHCGRITDYLTPVFQCLEMLVPAPLLCHLIEPDYKKTMGRHKWSSNSPLPFSKMASNTHNSPLYLSTAVWESASLCSPRPPSLLGNLLCKYGLLTADGLFQLWRWKCNYRQQTSLLLSLEGATLISVPSATGAGIDRYQLWGGDY